MPGPHIQSAHVLSAVMEKCKRGAMGQREEATLKSHPHSFPGNLDLTIRLKMKLSRDTGIFQDY